MHRSDDFDEYLAGKLQDVDYARSFLEESMRTIDGEPGLELWPALKILMGKMGQVEFANLCGKERSAIARYLKQEHPPKLETLNELLSPLGLRVSFQLESVA